jgi:O-antigen/teichoic acid export membrane protein
VLGRSVTLNLGGQLGTLAVGFATSVLLARWLGPADRGLLALLISVAGVTVVVAGLGLPLAVLYHASRRETPQGALLGDVLAYAGALALVLVPGAWLLREPIADLLSRGRGDDLWVLAAALVPLLFLDHATRNQLAGQLRFGRSNVLGIGSSAVTLVAVVVLLGALGAGVGGGLVAAALGPAVAVAAACTLVLRTARLALDGALLRRLADYGRRVQLGSLFHVLNLRLDVLVLQAFRPLRDVGIYVAAQVVAELVLALARGFHASVVPLVAGTDEHEERARTTEAALGHHAVLALAAVLGNAVFGPLVILLYGDDFHPALLPFFVLLPGMWFLGTATVVGGDLRGRGRPGLASALTGLAVALTLALDLALIPPFGVAGAAVASLVAYTVYGIGSLVVLARVTGIPLRRLAVPRREDLRAYGAALRRLRRGAGRSAG